MVDLIKVLKYLLRKSSQVSSGELFEYSRIFIFYGVT